MKPPVYYMRGPAWVWALLLVLASILLGLLLSWATAPAAGTTLCIRFPGQYSVLVPDCSLMGQAV